MSDARSPEPSLRAGLVGSLVEGWRRSLAAPVLGLGLLVATVGLSAPLAETGPPAGWLPGGAGAERAPDAGAVERAAWAAEFGAGVPGLGAALGRQIAMGPAGPASAIVLAGQFLLWMFLAGGITDRLARARSLGPQAFFAVCGGHLGPMVRLGAASAAWCLGLLSWWPGADLGAAGLSPGKAGLAIAVLVSWTIADFAKVRLVVEDRRSAISAVLAALRFVGRRPARVAILTAANAAVLVGALAVWDLVQPPATWTAGQTLAVGLGALLVQIWARLAVVAAEVAFFQGELAHAGYTAKPWPIWPDSPSAEAIENFAVRHANLTAPGGPEG